MGQAIGQVLPFAIFVVLGTIGPASAASSAHPATPPPPTAAPKKSGLVFETSMTWPA